MNNKKQLPEVFLRKSVLRNFAKFAGKHLCQSFFFNKVPGLGTATLLKKRLWHRCFPVNFAKNLKNISLIEHLRWLLSKLFDTTAENFIITTPCFQRKCRLIKKCSFIINIFWRDLASLYMIAFVLSRFFSKLPHQYCLNAQQR